MNLPDFTPSVMADSPPRHVVDEDAPVLYRAIVRTPVAPMHGEPRIASQMISQQVAGHALDVLEDEGDWVRAMGADRYDGWMHTGFLSRCVPTDATTEPATAERRATRISLGCLAETPDGHQ